MKFKALKASEIFIFLLASAAIVATSAVNMRSFKEGQYRAQSDCADAVSTGITVSVTIENNSPEGAETGDILSDLLGEGILNINPSAELGFPNNQVEPRRSSHEEVLIVDGENRYCKAVAVERSTSSYIFACFDKASNNLECTITLTYEGAP